MTDPINDPGNESSGGFSLKAVIDKNPIQISAAIMSVVNFAVAMAWVHLTKNQTVALNLALFNVLSVFTISRTTNTAKLAEFANVVQLPPPAPEPKAEAA